MPDWGQFVRNLAYGAVHRPAQVVRWVGEQLTNEAAPIGAAYVELANQLDAQAYEQLQPYVPPLPPLTWVPPPVLVIPPPPPPPWVPPVGYTKDFKNAHDPTIAPLEEINAWEAQYPGTVWSSPSFDWWTFYWSVTRKA